MSPFWKSMDKVRPLSYNVSAREGALTFVVSSCSTLQRNVCRNRRSSEQSEPGVPLPQLLRSI